MKSQPNDKPPPLPELSISALEAGLERIQQKGKSDSIDKLEVSKLENIRTIEEIKNLRSDRVLREKYADKIMRFLQVYASIVGVLIFLHGFGLWFSLPDQVLITLAGSTAVAAIGLVGFVAKGLFNNQK